MIPSSQQTSNSKTLPGHTANSIVISDSETQVEYLSKGRLRRARNELLGAAGYTLVYPDNALFWLQKVAMIDALQSQIASEHPDQLASRLTELLRRGPLYTQLLALIAAATNLRQSGHGGDFAVVLYVWLCHHSSEVLGADGSKALGRAVSQFYAEREGLILGDDLVPLIYAGHGATEIAALRIAAKAVRLKTKIDDMVDLGSWQHFSQSFADSLEADARWKSNQDLLRLYAAHKLLSGVAGIEDVSKDAERMCALADLEYDGFMKYTKDDTSPKNQTWLHLGFLYELVGHLVMQDMITEDRTSRLTGAVVGFSELAYTCYAKMTESHDWKPPPGTGIQATVHSWRDHLRDTYHYVLVKDSDSAAGAALGDQGEFVLRQKTRHSRFVARTAPTEEPSRFYTIKKPEKRSVVNDPVSSEPKRRRTST